MRSGNISLTDAARAGCEGDQPSWRNVTVDIAHILERHIPGSIYSKGGSVFPATMNEKGIMRAIRQAYRSSAKVGVQGTDRVLLQGKGAGFTIEMWFKGHQSDRNCVPGNAMTIVRLVVDSSSMSFRSSGPATGDISLLLGNVVFPSAGWNDFVVVIVGAWVTALVRLMRRGSASERVHFMEGPYAVDITLVQTGTFRLRAFERSGGEYAIIEVPAIALLENAEATADEVLQMCHKASDRSADADQLELALAALQKEVSLMTS